MLPNDDRWTNAGVQVDCYTTHMMETKGQHYFLLALLLGALVLAFYILQPFLAPLVLGAVFAVVLQPLYRRLTRYLRGRESLAALATVLISIVLLLIPLFFIGFQILREAQELYVTYSSVGFTDAINGFVGTLANAADSVVPGSGESIMQVSSQLDTYARQALGVIVQHFGDAFSGIAGLLLALFIFFVTLYYLLRDGKSLVKRLIDLSPLSDRDDEKIFSRLDLAVNSVIKGMLAIAFIQGVLCAIGFAIFSIPNPVFWGLVAAFAALIPAFGTALVIAPAVIYLALGGDIVPAVGLAVWGSVAVGLVDNMISPYFMSRGMHLHPLLVLLSVLGGIILFGPVGIFLGPLALSLLIALLSLYEDVSPVEQET